MIGQRAIKQITDALNDVGHWRRLMDESRKPGASHNDYYVDKFIAAARYRNELLKKAGIL